MTFLSECGADKSISSDSNVPTHLWIHNDSMYVRFGGIRNTKSKLGFYVPFNSQGHIGTGPQNCHLWDSNPQR